MGSRLTTVRRSRIGAPGRLLLFGTLLCVAMSIVGGVALAEQYDNGDNRFVFVAEGVRLTAVFGQDEVRLEFSDGREVVLEQAISASGARYTDGDTLFWTKGDEALLEWEGRTYNTRIATSYNDVWERARSEGVRFRGVGNEPGWAVEIREGGSVHLSLDYGMSVLTMPLTEFHLDYTTGTRTYTAKPPTAPLHAIVSVEAGACYDTMSGEGFTSAVSVAIPSAGLYYKGCGRDL